MRSIVASFSSWETRRMLVVQRERNGQAEHAARRYLANAGQGEKIAKNSIARWAHRVAYGDAATRNYAPHRTNCALGRS